MRPVDFFARNIQADEKTRHGSFLTQKRKVVEMNSPQVMPTAMQIQSAVSYSGISRSRLYVLMRGGEIEAVKVGKRRLVLRRSIDAFLERQPRAA